MSSSNVAFGSKWLIGVDGGIVVEGRVRTWPTSVRMLGFGAVLLNF
jgi:hypothetical protein